MKPDFGEFIIPPHPDEAKIVAEQVRRARLAPRPPPGGKVTVAAIDGTNRQLGYVVSGQRLLHIHVVAGVLEVVEVWGGVVTARKTGPIGRD